MKPEVLGHGDDERPPSGPGRLVGAAVALVLLALVGVSVSRSRDDAREAREARERRPAASPTTPFGVPTGPEPEPEEDDEEDPDPFERFVTVRRPPPGVLRTVLLTDGRPGFLVPEDDRPARDDVPTAIEAIGGPEHARVLVGWCSATRLFQDVDGTVFYDRNGARIGGGDSLFRHSVRVNARDGTRLDVAGDAHTRPADTTSRRGRPCPRPLYLPTLPERAAAVHETITGYRVVPGRYVVTTETRAFCRASAARDCAADGWEVYQLGTLPPRELAGSYTYEGDFLVRGGSDGALDVVRLPRARLVSRERVGVRVRLGFGVAVRRAADGSYRLDFNPARHVSGDPDDEGDPGPTEPVPSELSRLLSDESPDVFAYRLRPDVEVVLGLGITGPGRGRATARTLERFLEDPRSPGFSGFPGRPLWLVFDAAGAVLRVIAEP